MRGNRTLLVVVAVLIILVMAAGGVYLYMQSQKAPEGEALVEATPTPEPVVYTDIVIAMQNISRGLEIKVEDNAIALQRWPQDALPPEYYTSVEEIDGKFARMDIPRGMPILPNMLGAPGGMLAASGSAAALFEPADRVAYAIPMDTQGAVAWALKPGDRVDVIAALSITSLDPQLAAESVKQFTTLVDDPDLPTQVGYYGHFELLPNGLLCRCDGPHHQFVYQPDRAVDRSRCSCLARRLVGRRRVERDRERDARADYCNRNRSRPFGRRWGCARSHAGSCFVSRSYGVS